MKNQECYVCKECFPLSALRPYGEDGQDICFGCVASSPAREREAQKQFLKEYNRLEESGCIVVTSDGGLFGVPCSGSDKPN